MKKIIFILMFLICLSSVSAQISYFFEVKYDLENNKLELNDLDLIEDGDVYSDSEFVTHDIKLFSFNDEVLYNYSYYWNAMASYDYFPLDDNTIGPEKPNYDLLQLNIPYFRNGKEIRVTDLSTREMVIIDVSKYASCNEDYVCDFGEDERSCPEDCRIEIIYESDVQENIENKEESIVVTIKEKESSIIPYFVVGVLIIIILGIIVFIIKQKRKVYK
jgi:hypothetical protein